MLFLGLNRIPDFTEIDKLKDLRSLIQVSFANNAVARKPLYRSHIIRTLTSVRILDGKEVLPDERERADLLFCQEPEPSPQPVYIFTDQQHQAPVHVSAVAGGMTPSLLAKPAKLPVKVTSLNFGNGERAAPAPERKQTGPTIMALGQGLEPSGLGDLRPPSRSATRNLREFPRSGTVPTSTPGGSGSKDLKSQRKSSAGQVSRQSPRIPSVPQTRR